MLAKCFFPTVQRRVSTPSPIVASHWHANSPASAPSDIGREQCGQVGRTIGMATCTQYGGPELEQGTRTARSFKNTPPHGKTHLPQQSNVEIRHRHPTTCNTSFSAPFSTQDPTTTTLQELHCQDGTRPKRAQWTRSPTTSRHTQWQKQRRHAFLDSGASSC